ncbi:hypothetical protein ACLHDG_10995 [Sulfurovum sp. CS9]|uniref:hypothetical protein n=1 Tax=Sulfurovum sp. CS9 TaxID=3391146 RepID=UPI0039EAC172
MLQSKIILVWMLVIGYVLAVDEQSNIAKPILTVELQGSEGNKAVIEESTEVAALKEKIKKLESELAEYRKGTPKAETIATATEETKVVESPEQFFKGAKLVLGGKTPEYLTTYYASNPQSLDGLQGKLKANGFTVLATTPILNGKTVITITNDELQKTNTLLATLHVLVNEEHEVLVQNPSYFGAAYLQDKYKYGQFSATLKALQAALGDMYEVNDKFELDDLSKYQFMFGMPYLDDTITVAEGDDLLEKVEGEHARKYVAYTLELPNGTIIVGHKLRNETKQFLTKIKVERNANILPYESMIKEGKAVILDPKYYLALSLPLLHMSDFMKIASSPEEIEKDIKRAYK